MWLLENAPDRLRFNAPIQGSAADGLKRALALLWAYSMRSTHLYGIDIQQEHQGFFLTAQAGRWRIPADGDAYRAMLSITALPALLSTVVSHLGYVRAVRGDAAWQGRKLALRSSWS